MLVADMVRRKTLLSLMPRKSLKRAESITVLMRIHNDLHLSLPKSYANNNSRFRWLNRTLLPTVVVTCGPRWKACLRVGRTKLFVTNRLKQSSSYSLRGTSTGTWNLTSPASSGGGTIEMRMMQLALSATRQRWMRRWDLATEPYSTAWNAITHITWPLSTHLPLYCAVFSSQ